MGFFFGCQLYFDVLFDEGVVEDSFRDIYIVGVFKVVDVVKKLEEVSILHLLRAFHFMNDDPAVFFTRHRSDALPSETGRLSGKWFLFFDGVFRSLVFHEVDFDPVHLNLFHLTLIAMFVKKPSKHDEV